MRNWFALTIIVLLVLLGGLGYLLFYSLRIQATEERLYTFLIDTSDAENKRSSVHVLFYHYPENFFLAYQLSHKLAIPLTALQNTPAQQATPASHYLGAYTLSSRALIKALRVLYNISIDFNIKVSQSETIQLLKNLGGVSFFNLHSDGLPKGVVFIDHHNYIMFLANIADPERVQETALSIWYSLFCKQLAFSSTHPRFERIFSKHLAALNSTLNRRTISKLLQPLLAAEGANYFYLLRNNLVPQQVGTTELRAPLEHGRYDRQKLAARLLSFKERQLLYEQFPITLQIKNTTSHKRFAARTAGVLRVKKIDVKEYLNSSIPLKHSVILEFAHSPLKVEYLQKQTQVDEVYKLFDYRENFDFSLYIANDYYGIQYLNNP